ncbi:MAG: DUF3011 domain-containing protein [Rubrivivax sp.]|nr:DUF3011 domain-containing protein [Rubrivivax sp.]
MTIRNAALAALTLLCLAGTQPATAEESGWQCPPEGCESLVTPGTIRCESQHDARKHCAVRNLDTGSVSLKRRLSESACQRDRNWGVDRDGIWVDNGCRAEFGYRTRPGGGGSPSNRPGRHGTITCESNDDRRKHCEVSDIDPDRVKMERQLSQTNCRRGENWGADARGIWVDNGCRAKFSYASRGGGSSGGSGASESSMRRACVNRASRDWAVTTDTLEITHAEALQNGSYRFNIQSPRRSGVCMVDRSGNAYRLD